MKLSKSESSVITRVFDYNKGRRFDDIKTVIECIVNTLLALWSIDRFSRQISVNDETYLVTEYKVDRRLLPFLGPRRVRIVDDGSAENLVNSIGEYDAVTPSEFGLYQEALLNAYRSDVQYASEEEVIARIGDAELLTLVPRLFSPTFDRRVEQNGPNIPANEWPVYVPIVDKLYKHDSFVMRKEEYLREMCNNVAVSLRN